MASESTCARAIGQLSSALDVMHNFIFFLKVLLVLISFAVKIMKLNRKMYSTFDLGSVF
jgi:hypothetical protein